MDDMSQGIAYIQINLYFVRIEGKKKLSTSKGSNIITVCLFKNTVNNYINTSQC